MCSSEMSEPDLCRRVHRVADAHRGYPRGEPAQELRLDRAMNEDAGTVGAHFAR